MKTIWEDKEAYNKRWKALSYALQHGAGWDKKKADAKAQYLVRKAALKRYKEKKLKK